MDTVFIDILGKPVWFWVIFFLIVIGLLVFDLGILHRKSHEVGATESLRLTAMMHRFTHLKAALSLDVTAALVRGGVARSLWQTRGHAEPEPSDPALEHRK